MRPEDAVTYNQLMQESTQIRDRRTFGDQPAHQMREGVQKKIWSQNETFHIQIDSEFSDLSLSQNKSQITAVETLKNIRVQFPDEMILIADVGTYTFPAHQFIAHHNCHLTQAGSSIHGEKVHFDLANENITCENPIGHFTDGLNFTANQLTWNKKENKLYLNGEVHLVSSRIQEKESFAIADKLIYNLVDKTILLTSDKKVLFWQEGLALSAPEVIVHRDKPEETIEGFGDVHFSFTIDEQNAIDELFKSYL